MVILAAYIIPFRVSEITLFDQDQIIMILSWFDLLPIFSRLRSPKNNSTDPLIRLLRRLIYHYFFRNGFWSR